MIFEKFEIHHLLLRLKKPFETSFARFQDKDTVFVKVFTKDGLVGLGESPALPFPFYNYECTDTTILILEKFILPRLIGKEINTIEDLEKSYSHIKGHNMAKTGVEAAYWHLKSQEEGKPLWQLWGGVRKEIEAGISLGLEKDAVKLLAKVEKALSKGYRRIKIKIKPGMDISIAKAIRQKFPEIKLMFDANSAYTLKDLNLFKELDEYNLLMIEQPLAHDDIIDHVKLQKEIKTPICLDESIHTFEDARKAIEIGACKIINIKPSRVGGYWQAKKIAEHCEKNNIPVWCGGMLETGWGKMFNIHISSLNNFKLAGDTSGTDQYFEEDIITPSIEVKKNSMIDVPQNKIGYTRIIPTGKKKNGQSGLYPTTLLESKRSWVYNINENVFQKLTQRIIEIKG